MTMIESRNNKQLNKLNPQLTLEFSDETSV
jgi:hypothetical protein